MARIDGKKCWDVVEANPFEVAAIMEAAQVSSLVAKVMAARGIRSDEAEQFLNPSLERDWHDPYHIPNMKAGVDRIERALREGDKIAVFGDFDVDGLSATTILTRALRVLGGCVSAFIPRRFDEGYGLSHEALRRVIEAAHPKLIITVDTGIAAKDEVAYLLKKGIDVVVTDHHEPSDKVPQGIPVIDPKLELDCPSIELAGVGVALKLIQALGARFGKQELWRDYTDIATLGTVSDMMRLDAENRSLVADGIERLRDTDRPGLIALAELANVDLSQISAEGLSYSLIPRLNAAGRMADPKIALDLLMSEDIAQADLLAQELESINDERREIETQLTEQAIALAEATFEASKRCVVLGGEGWHEGVKGIVASRIVQHFNVPALIFSISDGVARGSGRTVGSVDLFHAVERCSDLLIQFGGHAGAVGVTLDAANLDAFRERLEEVLLELEPQDFETHGLIDAELELDELSLASIQNMDLLRPFGQGTPVPLFVVRGAVMSNRARVGREGEHFRFQLTDGRHSFSCIMFRAPNIDVLLEYNGAVDVVFEPVAEQWQGRTLVKLMVKDIICRTHLNLEEPSAHELVEELFAKAPDVVQKNEFLGIGDLAQFHTKLAGVSFNDRAQLLKSLQKDERLELKREPENPFDENAIAVLTTDSQQLGYLNRRLAAALAPIMDKGAAYYAQVSELTGGGDKNHGLNIVVFRETSADKDEYAQKESDRAKVKERLSALKQEELTEYLRQAFIGTHQFLDAQQQALDSLAAGNNTLCIMATGRGKSLIFHVHAARCALLEQKLSIFVYPLRALVNDQAYHLEKCFDSLGLRAKVLTGESTATDREDTFSKMKSADLDIILTTPEFLCIHADKFAQAASVGFVVIDEAHHAGAAKAGHRAAYNEMPRVLEILKQPRVLAVTATANDEVALRIQELLGIKKIIIDVSCRENLLLDDGRQQKDKENRLVSIVSRGEKTIIYVNSREQSVSLAASLRKRIWELGARIAYYNAGLSRLDRHKVEEAFRDGKLSCIVSTSAFGEGVNLPDVRHVVLYHMPFGAVEFNQMSGRAGRDNNEAWVHLLFGASDARINERILSSMAPSRSELICLYKSLSELSRQAKQDGTLEGRFSISNAELAAFCREKERSCHLDESSVSCGLSIFKELGFIASFGYGSARQLRMNEAPARVELEESIRYKEGLHSQEEFSAFKDWILSATSAEVLSRFNKPISPSSHSLQEGGFSI